MEVRAARTIAAAPEEIFAFLAEPDRHWQLLGRRLEPLRAYDGERSQVRLRGPLGIRRTLWIRLAVERPPHELVGRVEAGGGATIGTVRWVVEPAAVADAPAPGDATPSATSPASDVTLTARTDLSGWLDRLLLAAGGAHWLRRSLALTLAALEQRVGR
jgi:uncharacterized protein YndB with AHSA1/START domain